MDCHARKSDEHKIEAAKGLLTTANKKLIDLICFFFLSLYSRIDDDYENLRNRSTAKNKWKNGIFYPHKYKIIISP